ncbi:MAG: ABC transporter permease subunit, partial [Candidatus Dadabacteria bacterium]
MKKTYSILQSGEPWVWISAAALGLTILLLLGFLMLIIVRGLAAFWVSDVALIKQKSTAVFGEIVAREDRPHSADGPYRIEIKRGNRDLYGSDFIWINSDQIESITYPQDVYVLERLEWGNFYGRLIKLVIDGADFTDSRRFNQLLSRELRRIKDLRARVYQIEKKEIGKNSYQQEQIRLKLKRLARAGIGSGPEVNALKEKQSKLTAEFNQLMTNLDNLRARMNGKAIFRDAAGTEKEIALSQIVRFYQPNKLGIAGKLGLYCSKVYEFITENPRESNTEGGVFPAIFGTVMMVFIMAIVVTPFGVLAAIYLHEYAKPGFAVSSIRIAVNNLAGVPSIVFGVFGVGFFIYFIGSSIDEFFFSDRLPDPTFGTGGILWASLTLALLTVPTVIVATEEGLSAIPKNWREAAYALGCTKFEVLYRVVLPALVPAL